jgi:hypothetical protein
VILMKIGLSSLKSVALSTSCGQILTPKLRRSDTPAGERWLLGLVL